EINLEAMLAAADGHPAPPSVQTAVALLRRLKAARDKVRPDLDSAEPAILRVMPDPSERKAVQIRVVPGEGPGAADPFVISAAVRGNPDHVWLVVRDESGKEAAYDMPRAVLNNAAPNNVSVHEIRFRPLRTGVFRYRVMIGMPGGTSEVSGEGILAAVSEGADLDPFSGTYALKDLFAGSRASKDSQHSKPDAHVVEFGEAVPVAPGPVETRASHLVVRRRPGGAAEIILATSRRLDDRDVKVQIHYGNPGEEPWQDADAYLLETDGYYHHFFIKIPEMETRGAFTLRYSLDGGAHWLWANAPGQDFRLAVFGSGSGEKIWDLFRNQGHLRPMGADDILAQVVHLARAAHNHLTRGVIVGASFDDPVRFAARHAGDVLLGIESNPQANARTAYVASSILGNTEASGERGEAISECLRNLDQIKMYLKMYDDLFDRNVPEAVPAGRDIVEKSRRAVELIDEAREQFQIRIMESTWSKLTNLTEEFERVIDAGGGLEAAARRHVEDGFWYQTLFRGRPWEWGHAPEPLRRVLITLFDSMREDMDRILSCATQDGGLPPSPNDAGNAGTRFAIHASKPIRLIVVAEDDEALLKSYRAMFASVLRSYSGVRAEFFENGQKAWDFVREHDGVGLVMTDEEMPVLYGTELAGNIRGSANEAISGIPIIFASGTPVAPEKLIELANALHNDKLQTRATFALVRELIEQSLADIRPSGEVQDSRTDTWGAWDESGGARLAHLDRAAIADVPEADLVKAYGALPVSRFNGARVPMAVSRDDYVMPLVRVAGKDALELVDGEVTVMIRKRGPAAFVSAASRLTPEEPDLPALTETQTSWFRREIEQEAERRSEYADRAEKISADLRREAPYLEDVRRRVKRIVYPASLPFLFESQERWVVSRLAEADYRQINPENLSGARVAQPVDARRLSADRLIDIEKEIAGKLVDGFRESIRPVVYRLNLGRLLDNIETELRPQAIRNLQRIFDAVTVAGLGFINLIGDNDEEYGLKLAEPPQGLPTVTAWEVEDDILDDFIMGNLPIDLAGSGGMLPFLSYFVLTNIFMHLDPDEAGIQTTLDGLTPVLQRLTQTRVVLTPQRLRMIQRYDPSVHQRRPSEYELLSVKALNLRSYLEVMVYLQRLARETTEVMA
ncbi:MAG: response regulator, partial [Candidatus Omnitrophica bacterium]|nr:response regulator [Candidatus Omnitrophota bacterium]